jgi:serine/threonine protein kinase/Tol biopolymer transport system component
MPLPIDARLGPYQLLGLLGAGGMGEVYKARDTRLDRFVAIKVLPQHVADDPGREERFKREARAVAALNHPHICALYDVSEAADPDPASSPAGDRAIRFLVMEYLEGQTLAERLLRGPLPLPELMRSAIEIADALDHAHRKGLIHRDLKPANVMITKGGAKLLDFGLSRLQPAAGLQTLSTVSPGAVLTVEGAVMGTFPYMAPEQVAGGEADARSDIFAFGATLYEMASGRRAFDGATSASVIGAVLHVDPPSLSSRQPSTPAALERLVTRCLAKDPDDRWQTARDLTLELKWIADHEEEALPSPVKSRGSFALAGALAAVAAAALTTGAVLYFRGSPADFTTTRLTFTLPPALKLSEVRFNGPVTISPDGRQLAYVASGEEGGALLRVQALDSASARALPGTEGAAYPFWSPDSRSLGFFAQGKLKRIDASTGPPQTICDAVLPRGGTWSRRGTIVYSANGGQQMYSVTAAGGTPSPLTLVQPNRETSWPSFLPDGDHFVFFGRRQAPGIYVASLSSGETARLVAGDYAAAVYSPGHLLFLKGGAFSGTLLAQPFDLKRLELTGEPTAFAERVAFYPNPARADFSASETGTLIFGTRAEQTTQLSWFDRQGKPLGIVEGGVGLSRPALSPDDRTIAAERTDPATQAPDIWLVETTGGGTTRLTSNAAFEGFPVWSPDGRRVLYGSTRAGSGRVFLKDRSGTGPEELFFDINPFDVWVSRQDTDWSRDEKFIVFAGLDPKTRWDLWLMPVGEPEATRKPVPYLRTDFNEHHAQLSPDGHWLAYVSDDSGTQEVYVASFPRPNGRAKVSIGGGSEPRWRRDGRELFYLSPDGTLVAISVPTAQSGPLFRPGSSVPLFKTRHTFSSADFQPWDPTYLPGTDGQRILVNDSIETVASVVSVVLNWPAALSRR